MGFITDMRTIKRAANGEMDRDLETITGPAHVMFEVRRGSSAQLRAAVAQRQRMEARLDGAYLRDLEEQLSKDETGRTVLGVSNLAGMALATGDWRELAELAVSIDPNHWLVHELDTTA